MKRLVGPAVWLLVLTLTWLTVSCLVPPKPTVSAQSKVRLLDPSGRARADNAKKLKLATEKLNLANDRYNQKLLEAKVWENLQPEDVLADVSEIIEHWQTIQSTLAHYDESDP